MAKKNDSWGIEIGANAIKAMRLVRNGNRIELADYDILPFKQILTTPDLDVEEAIQVNLDTFLSKHEVSKSRIVASVPGHAAFARFAKLPPVEPKRIPGIVQYEAVQQIPFPIEQVEWDYQVFQQEDSPDVSVGIFAITKERVMQYLENYRRVNMRVDGLTLSPLAVYNAFAYETALDTEPEGTIYLDIGTSSTDVIISEPEGIWMRTLPIGGNNFTEALVRSFKLSYPKAEKLKREAGTSKYARQIFQAMRPVFADLVQELQRSLGYYQSLHRDSRLTKLVGVGSTFRLPGLQKFLKQQLQMEITRPDGFQRIEMEGRREAAFAEHAMNMCTAYGLALQGLDLEKISANVLPRQIQVRRMWKAKEPWIAAAAACVVAATGLAGARYWSASGTYQNDADNLRPQIESVYDRALEYQQQWQEKTGQADPRQRIENLRGMLEYRELWPKLIEDVSEVALSVDPQDGLLTTDYEQIKDIDRSSRQRLYVESVEADYSATGSNEGAPQYSNGQNVTASDFWPERRDGMDDESYQQQLQTQREGGWRPPRFQITLKGTTPFGSAPSLVSKNVVRWLEEHTERKSRPYRIRVRRDEVMSMAPVSTDGGGAGDDEADADEPDTDTGQTGGGGFRMPGMSDESETDTSEYAVTFEELFPDRPLMEEPRRTDWRFTVRWTVELLPPAQARMAARYDPDDAPATPADQQAGADAEAAGDAGAESAGEADAAGENEASAEAGDADETDTGDSGEQDTPAQDTPAQDAPADTAGASGDEEAAS